MKDILIKMFKGFIVHEASWNGREYTKTMDEAMIEVCDGNKTEGSLLHCFTYWSNDVQALAPYMGVALERNMTESVVGSGEYPLWVNENVPPVPDVEKNYKWMGKEIGWVEQKVVFDDE